MRLADEWLPYPPTLDAHANDLAAVRRAADDAGRPRSPERSAAGCGCALVKFK